MRGHLGFAKLSSNNQLWLFSALTVGIVAAFIRFEDLLRYPALPSADHGNYLKWVRILLGTNPWIEPLGYPPLFLLLLGGLLRIADTMTALRLSIAIPSAFLALPFYAIAQRYASRPVAFLGSVLFVFAEGYSEMTGWGGGPDFLALPAALGAMYFLLCYLDGTSRRSLICGSVLASVTVGTHQLTALVLILSVVCMAMLDALRVRSIFAIRPYAIFALWAGLFSLPFAPFYATLFAEATVSQSTPLWPVGPVLILRSVEFLIRESFAHWLALAALGVLGTGVLIRRARREALLLISILVAALVLALSVLRDNAVRPLYFLYIPILMGAVAPLDRILAAARSQPGPRLGPVVQAMLVASLLIASGTMIVQSTNRMSMSVDWYHAIEENELAGLDWIRTNTPTTAVIATDGLPLNQDPEGLRFGWWIEGYSERQSFYSGSLSFILFPDERAMVEQANRFFMGNYVLDSQSLRVAENHPSTNANPEISIRNGDRFRPVLFLNDAFVVVSTRLPSGNVHSSVLYPPSPGDLVNLTLGASPSIETVREQPGLVVSRQERISGGNVLISFAISTNTSLHSIELPLWISYGFLINSFSHTGPNLTFALVDVREPAPNIAVSAELSLDSAGSIEANATNSDPEFGIPVVNLRLVPSSSLVRFNFSLRLDFPEVVPSGTELVTLYDGFAIAKSYDVTYVFQSKRLYTMYLRFENDIVNYERVYENPTTVIYRVR